MWAPFLFGSTRHGSRNHYSAPLLLPLFPLTLPSAKTLKRRPSQLNLHGFCILCTRVKLSHPPSPHHPIIYSSFIFFTQSITTSQTFSITPLLIFSQYSYFSIIITSCLRFLVYFDTPCSPNSFKKNQTS